MSTTQSAPQFQLTSGHPLLDFINTLDWRYRGGPDDPQELLTSYDDLLGFLEQSELLTEAHTRQLRRVARDGSGEKVLRACIELREAAAEIFYASVEEEPVPEVSLQILARNFKTALEPQELHAVDSHLEWRWPQMEAHTGLPLWILSLSAASLMVSPAMRNVRACENPECRWLFVDTSKNHTRRWCDMKVCGNRMKARRFKAQHKALAMAE